MKNVWGFFIVGIFLSALVSVWMQNGKALAEDPRVKKIDDPAMSGLKVDIPPPSEADSALEEKEKDQKEKEKHLKEVEDRIAVEEARLKSRIGEMEKLESDIQQLTTKNKTENAAVLAKLVKTFESMNPKKSSGVIANLSDDLAVDLLMAMKEKKVATVLEVMEPTRAVALSSLMAKRRPAGKAVGETTEAQPKN